MKTMILLTTTYKMRTESNSSHHEKLFVICKVVESY